MYILLITPELNFFPQIEKLWLSRAESELINLSHGEEHTKMYIHGKQAEVEHEEAELSMFLVF